MAGFPIGDVEDMLRLPASTLRHWEKALSLLDPRKDSFGRRVYSEAEVRLLFRIKHYVQSRGLGLKATEKAIMSELGPGSRERRALLAEVRGELISYWASGRNALRRLENAARRRPSADTK